MRRALLALLLVSTALAGCLADGNGNENGDGEVPEEYVFEPQPWANNLHTQSAVLTVDVDPTLPPEPAPQTPTVNPGGPSVSGTSQYIDGPFMSGQGTYTIVNNGEEPLDYVNFFGGFTILGAQDADGASLPFDGGNVTLPEAIAPSETRNITINFEGRNGDAYVPIPGAEEFSAHVFFLAPYTAGTLEPASMHATVTSPADWTVLIASHRLSESVEGNVLTTEYLARVNYFPGYAAEGLLFFEDDVEGIEVKTFYYPSQVDQGRAAHETAVKIFRFVPGWTGPYPFDHLWTVPHHVAVNAFSYPTINHMGWTFFRPAVSDAPVQFGRDLIPIFGYGQNSMENVLVHETVHNWWGHDVRGNNSNANADGERDTWMTEGITTYLAETVWFDRLYGEASAKESAEHMVRSLQQDSIPRGFDCSVTEACGDFYVKGALSMRALEAYGIATDRPDFSLELLQHGLETFGRQFGGPGHADTSEFVAAMEEAAGEDLSWWYDAWHYSRELSDFHIGDVTIGADGITVLVHNMGGAKGAALVEVELAGSQTVREWAVIDANGEATLTIPLDGLSGPAVRATVDPLQHIYESDETNNVWVIG